MSCLSLVDRLSVGVIVHTLSLLPARLIQVKNDVIFYVHPRATKRAAVMRCVIVSVTECVSA